MHDPSTTTLIVNPAAAAGRVGRVWPRLGARLTAFLGPVSVRHSTHPGDARRLAAEALISGARTIVSLGGDGTHNEVINGFGDAEKLDGSCALGILPAGTGGDLRRVLDIGQTIDDAARAIVEAPRHLIDVGRLGFETDDGTPSTQLFLNVASFGMSGLVDRYANASSKRLGGRITFLVATFRALAAWKGMQIELTVDGVSQGTVDAQNIVLGNARYFGGGMHVCPDAQMDDGCFDVVALPELSMIQAARHIPRLYRGTHLDLAGVRFWRASRVEARPVEGTAWLDVDGEAPGRAPVVATVVRRAIRLVGVRANLLGEAG